MANARTSAAAAALLLGVALPAAAADEAAEIRRDLSALVAVAQYLPDDHDGPSPTLLARRLLERREKAVQPVLKEAWEAAGVEGSPAAEQEEGLRRVVRFLHGLEAPPKPAPADKERISFGGTVGMLHEVDGIVLVRPGGSGERGKVMGEPGWDRDEKPSRPKFEALVKGGKWRRPGRTDSRRLAERLEKSDYGTWTDDEKRAFAIGAGEALGADPGFLPRLLKAYEDAPSDDLVARAVAWAGAPSSVEALRARIAPLAERVAGGREAALPLLAMACRGVRRASPETLVKEIGRLEGAVREAALEGAGFRTAVGLLLAEHDAAADDAAREAAVLRMVRLILRAHFSREFAGPADMPRVVKAFRAVLENGSPEGREWAEKGAYGLFYMGWRDGKAGIHFSSNEVSVDGDGDRLGPYPGTGAILAHLEEDLASGNLAFSDDAGGIFDRAAPPPFERGTRAWSGVKCPIPNTVEAEAGSPLRLQGEKTAEGLRFTLTNAGKKPFAVVPAAFRYACADFIPITVKGVPGGPRSFTELKIEFGVLGGWARWTAPARTLAVLDPGKSFSWEIGVAPGHRDADHVCVSLNTDFRVPDADGKVPILRWMGESWVR